MSKAFCFLAFLVLLKSFCIAQQRFICYFPNWTTYREGNGKFTADMIDPSLCTHYNYAFAILNNVTWKIDIFDYSVDITQGGYSKFNAMKQQNPGLKTMIAIGGWTDSEVAEGTGPGKYSQLVSDPQKISTFVNSVMTFLNTYGFDGLDLDWEYPGEYPDDKKGFTDLCKALRAAFIPKGYLLSAAVAANEDITLNGYETEALNALDFVNVMTYDMHGPWENTTDHHAPLYKRSDETEENNIDYIITNVYMQQLQIQGDKINLGIPMYGKSWTLSSDDTGIGASAWGDGGAPGPITQSFGTLAYSEICFYLDQNIGWTMVSGTDEIGPYAFSGEAVNKTWVSYDDVDTVIKKTEYAKSTGLGGVMVWDLSSDDFKNLCGGGENPIGNAIFTTLKEELSTSTTTTSATTSTTTTSTTPSTTSSTITTTTETPTITSTTTPSTTFSTTPTTTTTSTTESSTTPSTTTSTVSSTTQTPPESTSTTDSSSTTTSTKTPTDSTTSSEDPSETSPSTTSSSTTAATVNTGTEETTTVTDSASMAGSVSFVFLVILGLITSHL